MHQQAAGAVDADGQDSCRALSAGAGLAAVPGASRRAGSNGGIGRLPEMEMFPVFPVLFPVCSQSWRNGFLKFPVFRISCGDPY